MRRALLIAAAFALAGFLAGHLSAGGPSSAPRLLPDSPGPTRLLSGGVGAGYAHSRAGAIAATAGYQRAFADPAVLHPKVLRARVRAVATPDFAPTMIAANEPGARRIAEGPLGDGLRAQLGMTYLGVPIAYRVLAYSPRRAVIRTWGLTVLGNRSTVEPAAYFGSGRMELVWTDADWKIASTRGSFGPTPRLATPRRGGEGFEVADVLRGMRSYAPGP
jgi:hypothetical protein